MKGNDVMKRLKLDTPKDWIFSTKLSVRITDINYGGHLGNDAMVPLLHEAKLRWLASMGYESELDIETVGLLLADLQVSFLQQAFNRDVLDIDIGIGEFAKTGFELCYRVKKEGLNIVLGKTKTLMVFYSYKSQTVVRIPETFKNKIST